MKVKSKTTQIDGSITVFDLAHKLGVTLRQVCTTAWTIGMFNVFLNSSLDRDEAITIAREFGFTVENSSR